MAWVERGVNTTAKPMPTFTFRYAEQLTRDATQIGVGHHERLRGAGFDDRAILHITLIAGWFNYINGVADALGVGRSSSRELS